MAGKKERDIELARELSALLEERFDGMNVEVGESPRWDRKCLTFRWPGFEGLLPEERFHRLVTAIPESFRKDRLEGLIWLELSPGESVDAFLKLPRSEDVAKEEAAIYAGLSEAGFFKSLADLLGTDPTNACPGDFSRSAVALSAAGYTGKKIAKAKCVFIRHGVYCDCQVLQSVRPVLAKLHTGAA